MKLFSAVFPSLLIFLLPLTCAEVKRADSPFSCYTCAGFNCLAQPQFQEECNSKTTKCFYVTANNTEMYRGCYEEQQEYHWLCKEHILNTCVLCNTTLCNDQPPYNPDLISCYHCSPPSSRCREPQLRRDNLKLCKRSLFTDRPACYSLYDQRTFEYEFGCLSETSLAVRVTCDNDWFDLTCQICYMSNCNVDLFYVEHKGDLVCYGPNDVSEVCAYNQDNLPYYGCYIDLSPGQQDKGCISRRFAFAGISEWMDLMRIDRKEDRFRICKSSYCNSAIWQNVTMCGETSCVTEYDHISICIGLPTDQFNVFQGVCRDRYPCWSRDLCYKKKCTGNKVLPNGTISSCLKDRSLDTGDLGKCYQCTDCPSIPDDYESHAVDCPEGAGGCSYWMSWEANATFNRACGSPPSGIGPMRTSQSCGDTFCNNRQFSIECINCSFKNPLCTYDPMNTWYSRCSLPMFNESYFGCYSRKRRDGLVERGCFDGQDEDLVCDADSECKTCRSNFCNTELHIKSSCIECSSDLNGACASDWFYLSKADDSQDLEHASVDTDCPLVYNQPLCYTIFGPVRVERGCYAKLFKPVLDRDCGPLLDCHYCDTELCNYWIQAAQGSNLRQNNSLSGAGRWLGWWVCWLLNLYVIVIL